MDTEKIIPKGLVIDGVAGSQAIDSSGEILDVEGADITEYEEGRGLLNYEHKNEKDDGSSFNDVIGRIIFAKKIFKASDCANDRERKYWNEIKLPLIYIQAELFDADDHPGAKAAAAMIRHYHDRGLPLMARYSVEGTTLEKEGNVIKRSLLRRLALTVKPCNKSCHSGVLEDPKEIVKPKDKLDNLTEKNEHEHPNYQKLGGSVELECDPILKMETADWYREQAYLKLQTIKKTLTAGSYAGAPSTLTGGSALQVEDRSLHRAKFRNQVLAAARDYRRSEHGDLKVFLKHRLPEADPDFIDMFADMVKDYQVKKTEADLAKALTPPNDKKTKTPEQKPEVVKEPPAVVGLKPPEDTLKKLPKDEPWFHDEAGILHVPETKNTPRKMHKVHIPGPDFEERMDDPEIVTAHEHAVRNWMDVHNLMAAKKLPPRVAMLAALLGFFSANEGVPVQELATAHAMDLINEGYDPSKGPLSSDQQKDLETRWASRQPPEYMGEQMAAQDRFKVTGKNHPAFGQFKQVGNGSSKIRALNSYHKLHDRLMGLVKQHGDDGRSIANELIKDKAAYEKWKNTKDAKNGGEYDGVSFDGVKNKILRYVVAMMGGGNIHVPDTHFIRHTFNTGYGDHNKAVKDVLWEPSNAGMLDQIDRYYYNHHPAVRKTIERYFGGQPTEQAIFPAFWWHWLTIGPDELARGLQSKYQNDGTDHAVYFKGIQRPVLQALRRYGIPVHNPELTKSEVYPIPGIQNVPIEYRAAYATEHLRQQYGEGPASWAFHAYMYPALKQATRMDELKEQAVQKMEALTIELRHAASVLRKDEQPQQEADEHVVFRGKFFKPGEMVWRVPKSQNPALHGNKVKVVGHSDNRVYFHEPGRSHDVMSMDMQHVPTFFDVTKPVEAVKVPLKADTHGIPQFIRFPEQSSLIDGTDLTTPPARAPKGAHQGINDRVSHWRKMANGSVAYIKRDRDGGSLPSPHREAMTYNLARDMGLGQYFPVTSIFRHPVDGSVHSVMEKVQGGEHLTHVNRMVPHPEHFIALDTVASSGDLHKLGLFDQMIGNTDRHSGNYLIVPDQKSVRMIDHGFAFNADGRVVEPGYLDDHDDGWRKHPLHPAARQWLMGLDPDKYEQTLVDHGMERKKAIEYGDRLGRMQDAAAKDPKATFGTVMYAAADPYASSDPDR